MANGAKSTVQTAMTPQIQQKMGPQMPSQPSPPIMNDPSLYSDPNLGGGGSPLPPTIPNVPQPTVDPNPPTFVNPREPGVRGPNVFANAAQGLNSAMAGAQNEMGYRPDRVYN